MWHNNIIHTFKKKGPMSSSKRSKSPRSLSPMRAVNALAAPVTSTAKQVGSLVTTSVRTAPVVHSLVAASRKPAGAPRNTHFALTVLVVIGLIVGIAYCDKYGRKTLSEPETRSQKTVDTALRRRFGLGVGVGIFVIMLAGNAGFFFLLLIAGFAMGTTSYLKDETQPWEARVIARRYYTGIFSGALLALGANHVMRHILGISA